MESVREAAKERKEVKKEAEETAARAPHLWLAMSRAAPDDWTTRRPSTESIDLPTTHTAS